MDNNFNLLSINYIANIILNHDNENLLITNFNTNSILEIISEISSNYLFKKEQILIISDSFKDNILDDKLFKYLDNRVIDLQKKHNIKDIITKLLLELDNKTGNTTISKVSLINRSISKKLDILKKINSVFCDTKDKNMSLIDKYFSIKNIKSYDKDYTKYYERFRIKNPLVKYNYDDIVLACNNILSLKVSSYYIKYRRFIDNDIFSCLRKPLNYNFLKENICKIDEIISTNLNKYKLSHTKYTDDFIYEFINNNDMNEEYITSLSNVINLKYNYKLLDANKKKKWFKLFSKNTEEYNLNLFSNYQKEICNEYINNLKIINKLEEKLSFLKEIILDESYNKLIVSIIKGEDLKEKLDFYKNIFTKAFNAKKIFEFMNKLSNIEIDILNYCYNDLEKKNDIDLLIKLMPIFKLSLEIEEEETKNSDFINIYNDYDEIIKNICYENYKRKSLIYNSINNIWDNQLRNMSSLLLKNIDNISSKILKNFIPCVISNNLKADIENLINDNFFFKKIILILDNINDPLYIKKLNKISENIIIFSNVNNYIFSEFKKINISELNKIKKINNKYDSIYKEIQIYLINKISSINVEIRDNYMKITNLNKKIIIKLSPEAQNNNSIIEDVFSYSFYEKNNIKFYRLWYRNWYLNKFKELKNIEKYIIQ